MSKDKAREISILADLNDCSIKDIAEIITDIQVDNERERVMIDRLLKGRKSAYHRDIENRELFYEQFGIRLRAIMDSRKISSSALAKEANVSNSAITSYTKGKRMPDIYTLSKISKALNVTTDILIEGGTVWK